VTTDAVNGQHPAQQTSPLGGTTVYASTKAEFSPALAFFAAPQLVPVAVAEASTEQWVWVYLLLEFQSEPDPRMKLHPIAPRTDNKLHVLNTRLPCA